jgi:hypothetical protein
MNFEYHYNKRATALLQQHNHNIDRLLQDVLKGASAKHELGDGSTLKKIKTFCVLQMQAGIDLLLASALDVIETEAINSSGDKLWVFVSHKIHLQFAVINDKKLKALKASQGANVNQRLVEASSLEEEYKQYRSDAKSRFDKALQNLTERREQKRKSAIMTRLYKKVFYFVIVVFLCVMGVGLFKKFFH